MNGMRILTIALLFLSVLFPSLLWGQEKEPEPPYAGAQSGWTSFARGGVVYQFDTDLDNGGDFNGTRFAIQTGAGYSWDRQNNVSFSVGYNYDGYDFSGNSGLGSVNPWEDIYTLSIGVPVRYGLTDNWTAFIIPSLRSTGESGADFSETVTGGVLGGFSYRVNDSLTIGPGFGLFSELEDSATFFPILLIAWQINDQWSLDTGRGLGATQGPGLTLNYQPNQKWRFGIGGRYEKLRFRLDEDGTIADGIGEDSSVPLFINGTYSFNPKTSISFVGGLELDGELKLEDSDGNTITEDSYETAIFMGLTFSARF